MYKRQAITRCIAHHFEFDFFPAGDASFLQDLADRRFLDAAMGDLLQFFLGIGNTDVYKRQLCGNISPAEDLYLGKAEDLFPKVGKIYEDTNNRTIISAGCDVPPPTSVENMIAFYEAVETLKEQ